MKILALPAAMLAAGAFMVSAAVAIPQYGKPDVTSFALDNGLEIVVIEDHRAPVVTHMVWYRVGSADETPGKTGIAHFLEHLMFKGTDTVAPGEFSEIVAANGGTDNAFTSQDYTAYHQRIARDRLGLMMKLEADRMENLRLTEDEVATERDVVLEERASRTGSNPGSRLSEQMDAALYLAHPYGHPVIGWESDIEGLTLKDAVDFYDRFYTPSNAILVVSGDVTPEEVRELAEETYGEVANRATVGPRTRPAEPPAEAARRVILEDENSGPERLRRSYLAPAFPHAGTGEGEALEILAEILGGGATSRLYRQIVVEQKLAVEAGAYYSGSAQDFGEFGLYSVLSGDAKLKDVEAAVDAVIADIAKNGVTDEELARAKARIIADTIYDQDSQYRMTRTFGAALATGSTAADVLGWPERVSAATAEAVRDAARKWLVPRASVTGILRRPTTGEGGRS